MYWWHWHDVAAQGRQLSIGVWLVSGHEGGIQCRVDVQEEAQLSCSGATKQVSYTGMSAMQASAEALDVEWCLRGVSEHKRGGK